MIMLDWAANKPIKPYALARAVLRGLPYGYGDEFIHIKRLGNKLQDLLAEAHVSLFLKDFPDEHTADYVASCSRTEEETRQEARRILNWLWDEGLERDREREDTEDAVASSARAAIDSFLHTGGTGFALMQHGTRILNLRKSNGCTHSGDAA
jgi:hypothetical protein